MFVRVEYKLNQIIRWLLLTTALVPLLYSSKFFNPYLTPKLFFVRGVILITLVLALILFLLRLMIARLSSNYNPITTYYHLIASYIKEKIKNAPKLLLVFASIFVISQVLSTVFAEFPYRAFWGTLERGQGLFNLLHFAVFFALLAVFFSRKDFERYFRFSLAVGAIVYFYAILQALKFTQFPFAFAPDPRPGSFLGNGAFLAAYSFFVMIAAVITARFSRARHNGWEKFWYVLSIVAIALSPVIIFLTRTRGALVGLGVVVIMFLIYFSIWGHPTSKGRRMSLILNPRFIAVVLLVFLIGFVIVLFITREAPMWQKIPGLDRVTQTLSSFGTEASGQVRLLGWKLALNAFLEKPILGWGPEHYLVAFERRYDPEFSVYGDAWLDRAHNGILDVAATQGALGLIGYVGFLACLLWFFFKGGLDSRFRFFIGAIFLGFVFQNLFLLEEFHTWALFFALAAAIVAGVFATETNNLQLITNNSQPTTNNIKLTTNGQELTTNNWLTTSQKILVGAGSVIILAATSFALYKTVLVPTIQAYYTHKTESPQSREEFLKFFNKATKPYNFTQYSIRGHLFDFFYNNQPAVFTDPKLADIGNEFVFSIREAIAKEGTYDVRVHIRLSQAHQEMAKQNPPVEKPILHYRAGEKILRDALLISPNRPELIYGLAFSLAGQERYEEAIAVMEKLVASNPNSSKISRLHYYYGLILMAGGKSSEALQAFENMKRASPQLNGLFPNDIRGLFSVYESLGEYARVIDIVTESAKGNIQVTIDLRYYEVALSYHLYQEDGENAIVMAEFIAKRFPERKNDMEAIIGLVKNGEWDILKNL